MLKNMTAVSCVIISALAMERGFSSSPEEEPGFWTKFIPKSGPYQSVSDEIGDEVVVKMTDAGTSIRKTAPRKAAAPAPTKKPEPGVKLVYDGEGGFQVQKSSAVTNANNTEPKAPSAAAQAPEKKSESRVSNDGQGLRMTDEFAQVEKQMAEQNFQYMRGRLARMVKRGEQVLEDGLVTPSIDPGVEQSNSSVSPDDAQQSDKGNWTEWFTLVNGQKATHYPNRVTVGPASGKTKVILNGTHMNGTRLNAPLEVRTDMNREEFIDALKKSGLM